VIVTVGEIITFSLTFYPESLYLAYKQSLFDKLLALTHYRVSRATPTEKKLTVTVACRRSTIQVTVDYAESLTLFVSINVTVSY